MNLIFSLNTFCSIAIRFCHYCQYVSGAYCVKPYSIEPKNGFMVFCIDKNSTYKWYSMKAIYLQSIFSHFLGNMHNIDSISIFFHLQQFHLDGNYLFSWSSSTFSYEIWYFHRKCLFSRSSQSHNFCERILILNNNILQFNKQLKRTKSGYNSKGIPLSVQLI